MGVDTSTAGYDQGLFQGSPPPIGIDSPHLKLIMEITPFEFAFALLNFGLDV